MSLYPLNSFFSRFKHITPPDESVRKGVCEFILKEMNIETPLKDVSVKNGVIYIKTKPIIKNEVFMKKKKLLLFVQEKTKKTLHDVR